nr:MAG TPA: formyltransferase domain protein [Caudoviricetes sp.]
MTGLLGGCMGFHPACLGRQRGGRWGVIDGG